MRILYYITFSQLIVAWKNTSQKQNLRQLLLYTTGNTIDRIMIAAHTCQQQHRVDWSAAKVRCAEQHHWKGKVLEAIHIQQQANTSNLDCGLQISPVWLPLIKKPQWSPASFCSFFIYLFSHFQVHHFSIIILFLLHTLFAIYFSTSPHLLPFTHTRHTIVIPSIVFPIACKSSWWRPPVETFFYKVFLYATISWEKLIR